MNTIKYKDLKDWYLNNRAAVANAAKYFGDKQPLIHRTGFYSAPSWNWGYVMGIVGVSGTGNAGGNGIQSGTVKYFEVVIQSGQIKAAREFHLPLLQETD